MERKPWHGVLVASALPYDQALEVDFDLFADHVAWLAASGCHGITPNGSLGEYQVLQPDERRRVVETALAVAPSGFSVIPGVGAYGSLEACRWAEHAAGAGAEAVMLLPPNSYRAGHDGVVEHYRAVAKVGLPIVAYNNPIDTRVDLVPELLARLSAEELIVAVKEFSLDPRRGYQIAELAPDLDVIAGSDDTVVEFATAGAKGWIAGFTNVFPRSSVELFAAAVGGDLDKAVPLYRLLHPLLRWDSKPEFVQAIKLSMDVAGRYGGPCRPPRAALEPQQQAAIRLATEKALAEGTS